MSLAYSARYKKYEPIVLTDEFVVTFPIFDIEDIDIFVDGVPETSYSLTAIFADGVSDNASITLSVPVAGVDVEIYGARDPRRENNYLPNSPNLSKNLQRDMDAITAVQQEQSNDIGRAIKTAPGDPVVLGFPLREAGKALVWDQSENKLINGSLDGYLEGVASAARSAANALASEFVAAERADDVAAANGYRDIASVTALIADSVLTYSAGVNQVLSGAFIRTRAEGFSYEVAASGATDQHIATAGGVKLYALPGDAGLTIEMFGGKADDAGVDNLAPLLAAIDSYTYNETAAGIRRGGPTIRFGGGTYHFSTHINLKKQVQLIGWGHGMSNGGAAATVFQFPMGSYGLIINSVHTSNDTSDPNTGDASGTLVEGILFKSTQDPAYVAGTSTKKHAIWRRARCTIRNCGATGWSGDGIYDYSNGLSGPTSEWGNSNLSHVDVFRGEDIDGSVIWIKGSDANAGRTIGIDGTQIGEWVIFDDSFLGNLHLGGHASATARRGRVNHAGKTWGLVAEGSVGSTTEPGTDSTVWKELFATTSGDMPNWFSGISGLVRGGGYRIAGNSTQISGYTEAGSPPDWVTGASMFAIDGNGFSHDSTDGVLLSRSGGLLSRTAVSARNTRSDGATITTELSKNVNAGHALAFRHSAEPVAVWSHQYFPTDTGLDQTFNYGGARIWRTTGQNTTATAGRGTTLPYAFLPNTLVVGGGTSAGRVVDYAASMPTTGTRARGEFVFNASPTLSSGKVLLGWSRLTNGSGHVSGTDWSAMYCTST